MTKKTLLQNEPLEQIFFGNANTILANMIIIDEELQI
jgi:hypothetical protein